MDMIREMLTDRGYQPSREINACDVWARPGHADIFVAQTFYPKISISILKDFLVKLEDMGGEHCILIYEDDVTPHVRELARLKTAPPIIELFQTCELAFNVTRHQLQPRFECLTSDQAAAIGQRFGVLGLPKMRSEDPIARYYNWPKGTIVRVIPPDTSLQTSYRVVK